MINDKRLLHLAVFLVNLAAGYSHLCNIENCDKITNLDLANGQARFLDPITDENESYIRLVGFRGSTKNCSVRFAAKTSDGEKNLKYNETVVIMFGYVCSYVLLCF